MTSGSGLSAIASAMAGASHVLATEIDPELSHPYRLLAQIRLGRGETEAAATAIRRFLELAPDDAEAGVYRQILENLTAGK